MTELSFIGRLTKAMAKAKLERVGMELSYFDVVELLGELGSLKLYIAELESELDTSGQKLTDCDAKVAELELLAYGSEQERLRQNALWGFNRENVSEK